MPLNRTIDRLHAHQAEALELMQRAEAMLVDGASRDVAGLARVRWALVRTLTAYQLFKHNEIFDPGLARASPANRLRLSRMKRACTDMGDAFRIYVQKWSAADTGAEWPAYRSAALAMIERLRLHVAREREEVGAFLMTQDRTPAAASLTLPRAAVPPRPGRPTPAG